MWNLIKLVINFSGGPLSEECWETGYSATDEMSFANATYGPSSLLWQYENRSDPSGWRMIFSFSPVTTGVKLRHRLVGIILWNFFFFFGLRSKDFLLCCARHISPEENADRNFMEKITNPAPNENVRSRASHYFRRTVSHFHVLKT